MSRRARLLVLLWDPLEDKLGPGRPFGAHEVRTGFAERHVVSEAAQTLAGALVLAN